MPRLTNMIIILCLYEMGYVVIARFLGRFLQVKTIVIHRL